MSFKTLKLPAEKVAHLVLSITLCRFGLNGGNLAEGQTEINCKELRPKCFMNVSPFCINLKQNENH